MTDGERAAIGAGAARRPFDTLGPGARQPADPMEEAYAGIPMDRIDSIENWERAMKYVVDAILPEHKRSDRLVEMLQEQVVKVLEHSIPISPKLETQIWVEPVKKVEDGRLIRGQGALFIQLSLNGVKQRIMRWQL